MALWFLLWGVYVESCLAFCSRVFFFVFFFFICLFSIVIISLGEERAGLCASGAVFCMLFARVRFCPFSHPLGVRGWLWLVIVALPRLFY